MSDFLDRLSVMCLTRNQGNLKFPNIKEASEFLKLIKNFGFETEIIFDPIYVCREYLLNFPNEIVKSASQFSGYGYFSKPVDSNVTIEKEYMRVTVPYDRPESQKTIKNASLWENYKIDAEIETSSEVDKKTKKMLLVISRIKDSGTSGNREVTIRYKQKNIIPISIYTQLDKLSRSLELEDTDNKKPEDSKLIKYYNTSARAKKGPKCAWCDLYTTPESLKDHILNKCKNINKDLFIECEKCQCLIVADSKLHKYFCGINWYY